MRRGFLGQGGAWRPSPFPPSGEEGEDAREEGTRPSGQAVRPEEDPDWVEAKRRYLGTIRGDPSASVGPDGRDNTYANWLHMALDQGLLGPLHENGPEDRAATPEEAGNEFGRMGDLPELLKASFGVFRREGPGPAWGVDYDPVLARIEANDASFHDVNLQVAPLGTEGATRLGRALAANTHVVSLALGCTALREAGAAALAEGLARNNALRTFWLHDDAVGAAGNVALLQSLPRGVSEVTRWKTQGGDACAVAAAARLKDAVLGAALTRVSLWMQRIGDAGAEALAGALQVNGTLKTLGLNENEIGDAGAQELARALRTNTSLTRLDLWRNDIHDLGADAFSEALKENRVMELVALNLNPCWVRRGWDVRIQASGDRDRPAPDLSKPPPVGSPYGPTELGERRTAEMFDGPPPQPPFVPTESDYADPQSLFYRDYPRAQKTDLEREAELGHTPPDSDDDAERESKWPEDLTWGEVKLDAEPGVEDIMKRYFDARRLVRNPGDDDDPDIAFSNRLSNYNTALGAPSTVGNMEKGSLGMADWGEAMPGTGQAPVPAEVFSVSGASSRFASDSSSSSSSSDEDYKGPSRISSDSDSSCGEDAAHDVPHEWDADFSELNPEGSGVGDFDAEFPSPLPTPGEAAGESLDAKEASRWAQDFDTYFSERPDVVAVASQDGDPPPDSVDAIARAFADL